MTEQPHYFRTPATQDSGARRDVEVVLAGHHLTLHTAPGVFSTDRLDLGTRVLLRSVPEPPPAGDLLDLGCGWGPVAITAALLAPDATVHAVDVNERSRELTRENAQIAGCPNVQVAAPSQVPAGLEFAAIWSNPPIRIGKAALHELLLTWLPRLQPGGDAYLVAQRNLGADSLQAWLAQALPSATGESWRVERHASAKGFRVLWVARG